MESRLPFPTLSVREFSLSQLTNYFIDQKGKTCDINFRDNMAADQVNLSWETTNTTTEIIERTKFSGGNTSICTPNFEDYIN